DACRIKLPQGPVDKIEMGALQVFNRPGGKHCHGFAIPYPREVRARFVGHRPSDGDDAALRLAAARLQVDLDLLRWVVETISAQFASEVHEALRPRLGQSTQETGNCGIIGVKM